MPAVPSDPAALLKQVTDQLKESQRSAGLDKADGFVKQLEDIKAKAEQGPGDLLDKVKDAFKSFMDTIDEAVRNPASLLGGAGVLAACASYYGKMILEKLKKLKAEAEKLFATIANLVSTVAKPLGDLGKGLGEIMEAIVGQLKGLTTLPQLVEGLAAKVKSPADLAHLDLSDFKKAIDISPLSTVFDHFEALKGSLDPIVQEVADTIKALAGFVEEAPCKVKDAFDVPVVGGCMCGVPAPMQAILHQLEVLKGVDSQPLLDGLAKTKEVVGGVDVGVVKKPMEVFSSSALEQLHKLESAVNGGKAAQEAAKAAEAAAALLSAPAPAVPDVVGELLPKKKSASMLLWGK